MVHSIWGLRIRAGCVCLRKHAITEFLIPENHVYMKSDNASKQLEEDRLFVKQYYGAGFCGTCGEGLRTRDEAIKIFGHCQYNGVHPIRVELDKPSPD